MPQLALRHDVPAASKPMIDMQAIISLLGCFFKLIASLPLLRLPLGGWAGHTWQLASLLHSQLGSPFKCQSRSAQRRASAKVYWRTGLISVSGIVPHLAASPKHSPFGSSLHAAFVL